VVLRIAQDAELNPSLPDAKYMLFANTISVGGQVGSWSSEACTLESIGLPLRAPRLRQIMSAILRKHLSSLIDPLKMLAAEVDRKCTRIRT